MLKKLIKYDLVSIFKFLLIFYSLAIVFSILTRMFFAIEDSTMMNIIAHICSGATISMIANILINNIMRLWIRFKQNLYGDESYLTHTLPVNKNTLYLSKILTSIITLFTSFLVIGITIFIAYYSKEFVELIKNILLPMLNIPTNTIIRILLIIILILFLEIINILQAGYTGIIIGHKKSQNKVVYSVLFGFITYTFTQIFALVIIFITALFNKGLMDLFVTNTIIDTELLKLMLYIASIIYMISILIINILNVKLFQKGVNVD